MQYRLKLCSHIFLKKLHENVFAPHSKINLQTIEMLRFWISFFKIGVKKLQKLLKKRSVSLPLFAIRIFAPIPRGLPFRWSKESWRSLFIGGGDMSSSSSHRDFSLLSLDRSLVLLLLVVSLLLFSLGWLNRFSLIDGDLELNSFSRASASRWAACSIRACCSTMARPISKLAWFRPAAAPKGPPGGPGGPPAWGRPAWLYILKRASRVISNAESGLDGFKPGGLLLPWSVRKIIQISFT